MGMFFLLRLSLAASAGGESQTKVKGNDEIRSAVDLLDWEAETATCLHLPGLEFELELKSSPAPP